MNADKLCNEWRKNPLVNPETKRAIKADGPKYNELKKLCKETAPKGSSPKGKSGGSPKGCPKTGLSDFCKKWFENKGINP